MTSLRTPADIEPALAERSALGLKVSGVTNIQLFLWGGLAQGWPVAQSSVLKMQWNPIRTAEKP